MSRCVCVHRGWSYSGGTRPDGVGTFNFCILVNKDEDERHGYRTGALKRLEGPGMWTSGCYWTTKLSVPFRRDLFLGVFVFVAYNLSFVKKAPTPKDQIKKGEGIFYDGN